MEKGKFGNTRQDHLADAGTGCRARQPNDPASPLIEEIEPRSAMAGTQVTATLRGQHLSSISSVKFSGEGLKTQVLPGGSASQVEVQIDLAPGIVLGERNYTLFTPVGIAQSPPEAAFTVLPNTGIKVQDTYTLQIRPDHPVSDFSHLLRTLGVTTLVSPQTLDQSGKITSDHPIGTGPFAFKDWVPGSHITLMRNDDYWGGRPTVPEIIFRFASGNPLIMMMIQGEIDICDTGSQTLATTAEQMGLNVRQMRNFYGERDIFLISRQGLGGSFTSPSGLNLWRVQDVNVLRYGSPDEPSTLNPDLIKDTAGLKIADQILEGLTVQQTRGGPQPCLAVRWPRDIDRKGWTIHLRKNVEFHDGVPLSAEAVVANLTRHRM